MMKFKSKRDILLIITFVALIIFGLVNFDKIIDIFLYIVNIFSPFIIGVILAFIIVIIAGAGALIFHQISIRKENAAEAEYLKKNLPSYSSITIISDFKEKDNNTLTAFKEAVRTGADIVTLDLCFNDAGDPMICSDYSKITDNTLPLSELFRVINTDEYKNIRLNLRLRQLGSLETFNKLISENAMSGRVILSGIDKERYGIIQGDKIAADLFYRYKPQKDPLSWQIRSIIPVCPS